MSPIPQFKEPNGVEVIPFAETNYRGVRRRFGIKKDDRRRHMYLVGKTGMGKSTVMENMIIEDIRAGHGVGVIDPHGDLVEKILEFIPANRINDIVYVNPADMDWPIAFNVLESVDEKHKHLVASGLMGVFKKIWPDVWSARMEYIMNNTILALLDYPGSTMMGIQRMLADKDYRKKVVDKITDPVVKMFWVEEFAKYNERFASEAIAPIQNKVGQFLSSTMIRNIVSQVKSTIDMREIMDNGKVLLLNLSKGRIGEDNARLLGGMIITKLQISAMERVDIPMEERRDFFLYVDEFQNFATESFASILSEARKYRLDLILAHQYLEQLDEKVLPAVFGNVGTIVCFRIGAQDAEFMEKEFMPKFEQTDLVNITKFNMYIRLMIDGVASEPFSATGLPPLKDEERTENMEKIIRSSRERYAKPRAIVEDKIARWTGMMGGSEEEEAVKPRKVLPKSSIFSPQSEAPRPLLKPSPQAPPALPEPVVIKVPEIMSLTDALKQPPVGFKSIKKDIAPKQDNIKNTVPVIQQIKKVPAATAVRPAAPIQLAQTMPIAPAARPTSIVPPPIPKKPIKLFNQSPRPIEKKLQPKTVVKLINKT